jgi:hypothetical protein
MGLVDGCRCSCVLGCRKQPDTVSLKLLADMGGQALLA